MSLFSRKGGWQEGEATVTHVEMLRRIDYGDAVVRVSYNVQPLTDIAFETEIESKVKMAHLPQAGHVVQVRFDPGNHEKLEVTTPPGEEGGTVTTPTVEIGWAEESRSSYIRPDGTRGYR